MDHPRRGSWLTRVLLALCALKVAVLITVFDPSGLIAFDLPKSLASRALAWPMAVVLALLLVSNGPAIVPRSRLHIAVAGVAVSWLIAAATAHDRYLAIYGEEDRYLGLTYLADMIVLYLACAVCVRTTRAATVVFAAIATGGAVALAYGGAQAIGADPFWWQDAPAQRPFSTFGNPDHFGHFLSVLFGLGFGAALAAPRLLAAGTGALAAVIALAAAALVATRGTAFGILSSALAGTFTTPRRARGAVGLALVGVALVAVLGATPLGERLRGTLAGSETVEDRTTVWSAAARAFVARALTGYGPDNFRFAYALHRPSPALVPLAATPQSSAHNWLLDAAVMTGTIGLVALVALVAVGTLEAVALARARPAIGAPLLLGWIAYWVHALVAVGSIAIGWVPWVTLGVVAGLRSDVAPRLARGLPSWVVVLALAVAIPLAASGARVFLANRDALLMEDASAIGETDAALAAADRAVARDEGRAESWNRLGIALDGSGQWAKSLDAYREAVARRPYEPTYWANVARSEARLALAGDAGLRAQALQDARRAIAADPYSATGHAVLAEIAAAFGMCDTARSEAAAAIELGASDPLARGVSCR